MSEIVSVVESVHLPKFSKMDYKISSLLEFSKKLTFENNKNSIIYMYKDQSNKVFGIKQIVSKESKFSKEATTSDIACSELYFLKAISDKCILFPKLIEHEFYKGNLLLLSEWVQGKSLTEFLNENPSNADFHSIFFQILLGLELLYNNFNIIHGDLHTDNILLKLIKKDTQYLEYTLNGTKYYTKNTGYVPVLWDFGFSRERTTLNNTEFVQYKNLFKFLKYNQEEFCEDHLKLLNSLEYLKDQRFFIFFYYCTRKLYHYTFEESFEYLKKFQPNSKSI